MKLANEYACIKERWVLLPVCSTCKFHAKKFQTNLRLPTRIKRSHVAILKSPTTFGGAPVPADTYFVMSMVGIQDPLGETDKELKTTLSCSYKVVGSVLVLLKEL